MTDPHLGKRLISATRLERWERRIETAVGRALARHQTMALTALRASASPDPFNLDLWDASVSQEVGPEVMAVLREAADAAVAFMTLPPAVQARILGAIDVETEAASFVARISGIGPLVADKLRAALNEGLRSGESIPKLSDRVQEAFGVGENRGNLIARTEVVSASNRSGHEAAGALQDSGTLLEKVWLSQLDDRTRDDHADMDGVTVPYDEPFVVGGEECDYPADASLSPEQSCNCRCTALFQELSAEGDVISEEEISA